MSNKKQWKKSTIAAQSGIDSDSSHGAVVPPLYMSSNYTFEGYDRPRKYDYSRSGNPTRNTLENAVSDLEGGSGGVITSTGMSALHLAFLMLKPNDLLIAPHDCYGGTYRLLMACKEKAMFNVELIDLTDENSLKYIAEQKPDMVLIETPSNPLLRISDIEAITKVAKQKPECLVVADNTFMSPILQNPLDFGVDIVLHSTTKYLNGHGDVVGGAVIANTAELHEKLAWWANCTGIVGAPFDSYMTLRGIRSLVPRIKHQTETAEKIVEFLSNNQFVENVYYPGIKTHPKHEIALKQQKSFGAMISFELKGGVSDVSKFLKNVSNGENKLFSLAESLGGFESLIAHPATMTHAAMAPKARQNAGIKDTLIRLSIGIEDCNDLINSLKTAFNLTYNDKA